MSRASDGAVRAIAAGGRARGRRVLALATLLAALGATPAAWAMPDGIAGYSGLSAGKSCVMCHPGGNPPTATLAGPTTLAAGATAEYTLTLKTDRLFGGVDVAVDDAAARLAPVSPMTKLLAGEITHAQPLPVVNGEVVVKLSVTAPPTAGTITLHADGQADNKPQIADSSAMPIEYKIEVTGGGVGGNGAVDGGTVSAVPVHGCAYGGGGAARDGARALPWLALLLGFVLVDRWRRD